MSDDSSGWRLDHKNAEWYSQRLNKWNPPTPDDSDEAMSSSSPRQLAVSVIVGLLWISVLYAALGWLVLDAFQQFGWISGTLTWTSLCLISLVANVVRLVDKFLFRHK